MINPKKVRLMTKLAVYEEGPGKKDLRINVYTDIMSRGLSFPYQKYIVHAVILYVIIVVLDIVCIRRYYTRVYEKMRVDIKQYEHNLYRLGRYIQKEKDRE